MTEPISKTGAEILQKLLHTPQVVVTRTAKRQMDAARTLDRLGLVTLEPGQVDSVVVVRAAQTRPPQGGVFLHLDEKRQVEVKLTDEGVIVDLWDDDVGEFTHTTAVTWDELTLKEIAG